MIATAIPMPYHISITNPHNDEHSALSLKEYVRSSLHCIKIGRATDQLCEWGNRNRKQGG